MEPISKAEFSIVTRASSSAWIPELIASAGPEVTETYIDFFTSTIRNRNTRLAYARACWQFHDNEIVARIQNRWVAAFWIVDSHDWPAFWNLASSVLTIGGRFA
jgi:hypothetical protein